MTRGSLGRGKGSEMTDCPTLSYTSTDEILPFFIPIKRPEKGTPRGRSLPVQAIIGSTPRGKSEESTGFVVYSSSETVLFFFFTILLCLVLKKLPVTKISLHPIRDLNLIERKKWTAVPVLAPYPEIWSSTSISNFVFSKTSFSSREPSMQDLIKIW